MRPDGTPFNGKRYDADDPLLKEEIRIVFEMIAPDAWPTEYPNYPKDLEGVVDVLLDVFTFHAGAESVEKWNRMTSEEKRAAVKEVVQL